METMNLEIVKAINKNRKSFDANTREVLTKMAEELD